MDRIAATAAKIAALKDALRGATNAQSTSSAGGLEDADADDLHRRRCSASTAMGDADAARANDEAEESVSVESTVEAAAACVACLTAHAAPTADDPLVSTNLNLDTRVGYTGQRVC